jgi:hypothetical protein
MNKIIQHKQVISEIKKLNNLLCEVEIKDISNLSIYPRKDEKLPSNKYFILHHSVTDKDAAHVVSILNNRTNKKTGKKQPLGIQYVIDKEGEVFRTLPNGSRGAHIIPSNDYPSAPPGIDNSNAQGVEVVAMDDTYIRPVQAVAALKLVKQLGFNPSQIYPHGKINPGHKSPSEGLTIKKFIDRNYDVDNEYDYDYSDFPESKRPEPGWVDMSQSEIDSEFEKIIDRFGVEEISLITSESDCEKYVKEVIELFGDKVVIEKKDNFCNSLLLGLPIKDFVEVAKETDKKIKKEEEKKKLEDEEKKKEDEEKKKEEESKKKEEESKKKEEEKESSLTEELKNFKRFIK